MGGATVHRKSVGTEPVALTDDRHDATLVAEHIDANPHGRGPSEARLAEHGTSVWAIVAYWNATNHDTVEVARDFGVPVEAIEAALAFYRRHKDLIDARLLLNAA
jgi:uncharacterized protein (DUF433 family)